MQSPGHEQLQRGQAGVVWPCQKLLRRVAAAGHQAAWLVCPFILSDNLWISFRGPDQAATAVAKLLEKARRPVTARTVRGSFIFGKAGQNAL